uniref:Uncharacterized protein n=1 Tax=Anguilla anguilla TaxID=7936 RepID=A0A0E9VCN7_ANGAN
MVNFTQGMVSFKRIRLSLPQSHPDSHAQFTAWSYLPGNPRITLKQYLQVRPSHITFLKIH